MDIDERIELITREPTEETVTEEDLRELLENKDKVRAYDGFEPSGILHLGSGLLRAIKLQDMLDAGVDFTILIADWFAYINNKMDGDLELIQKVGEYMIEGWKACGVDMDKVDIVWTSEVVKDPEYWKGVIDVAKMSTVNRTMRAGTIMGREEGEMQYTAQLMYPIMQAYDPFYLDADILQLGMDQRSATMLTREMAQKIDGSVKVPVHHHLLAGLQGPDEGRMGQETAGIESKMSKSKPDTAIFIHDDKKEIERKLKKAYCPEKEIEGNPVIEMWKYIIFRKLGSRTIERPDKFGGNLEINNFEELKEFYESGNLHPMDLKNATADAMDEILEPIRKRFEKGKAKKLYETVKEAKVTR